MGASHAERLLDLAELARDALAPTGPVLLDALAPPSLLALEVALPTLKVTD
jgi:hypothetical protein